MQGGSPKKEEEAVQVLQAPAERGPRDAPAVAGRQLACHLCSLGGGGLHHLGLVQAYTPPAQPRQWRGDDLHQEAV